MGGEAAREGRAAKKWSKPGLDNRGLGKGVVSDLADVKEVDAGVRGDGPVVVLAGPVGTGERLLLTRHIQHGARGKSVSQGLKGSLEPLAVSLSLLSLSSLSPLSLSRCLAASFHTTTTTYGRTYGRMDGWTHLHECGEAVLRRHLLDDLHHHQVLVDLRRHRAVQGRELVLHSVTR